MIRYFLAMALVAFPTEQTLADEPLPAPETIVVCSTSGKFCVTSDLGARTTFLRVKSTGKLLWSVPGWHRSIFVADDGQTIAFGYDGLNLLPRDVTLYEPIISIYSKGKLVQTVVLGDFYRSLSELTPTVSHYAWGSIRGFNRSNQLIVELVSGRCAAFNARTGKHGPAHPD